MQLTFRILLFNLAIVLMAGGCSSPSTTDPPDQEGYNDLPNLHDLEHQPDLIVILPDGVEGDEKSDISDQTDLPETPDTVEWEPQPCQSNDDCDSGYCLEVNAAESYCTVTCVEECPGNWECKVVQLNPPDLISLCVPPSERLCAICDTNVDCLFAGALCLKDDSPYGFCGKACSEADCPSGFICTEMDLDGALVAQCYPESGSCCGGGEWIECDFDNPCAIGQCHPTLGCTEEPVDADCSGQDPCLDYHCIDGECIGTPLASDWTLDGVDDDCDGETDEDAMLGLAVTGYLWSGGSGTAVDSAFSILGNTSGVTFSGTISDGKYVIRAGLPQPETTN